MRPFFSDLTAQPNPRAPCGLPQWRQAQALVSLSLGLALGLMLALTFGAPLYALTVLKPEAAQQGALIWAQSQPGAKVTVAGKAVPVLPDGRLLIALGRDAPAKVELVETLANGQSQTLALAVKQRKFDIQRIDGLPSGKVTPPRKAELQARINREVAEIKAARAIMTPYPLFDSGIEWPLLGRISGVYGSQRVLNGTPKTPHYGIDIARPEGTSVRAPADGVVRLIHTDNYYSGGTLILDHGYGLNSAFLHMKAFHVSEGDYVPKGFVIGTVGSTGRSTGPHLDWRITYNGVRVDPALVAGPMPKQ